MADDPLHTLWDTHFLGVQCVQQWADFLLWEKALNNHRELKCMVELGTGRGGFSLYLLLQCVQRGMWFESWDTAPVPAVHTTVGGALGMEKHVRTGDIFGAGREAMAATLGNSTNHPLLLFCDNGNKPREFAEFVPLLRPGDLVAVHDWGTEMNPPDIPDGLVIDHMAELADRLGAMTRFFVRV